MSTNPAPAAPGAAPAPDMSATLTAGMQSGNGHVTVTYPTPSGRPTSTAPVGHTHQPSRRPGDHSNDG